MKFKSGQDEVTLYEKLKCMVKAFKSKLASSADQRMKRRAEKILKAEVERIKRENPNALDKNAILTERAELKRRLAKLGFRVNNDSE